MYDYFLLKLDLCKLLFYLYDRKKAVTLYYHYYLQKRHKFQKLYLDCLVSNLKIKLINDNQNYKLYENSTFYFIELKKGIKVENKVILNIPNFTLRGKQFLFSIPSASTIGGPWGHTNLVCSVTDYNITIINEIDNTTNYTLNSMIIIPKL